MDNAKPAFKVDLLVFIVVALSFLVGLAYQYGFDNGFEKARTHPAKCPDHSVDGKKLSSLRHDSVNNVTHCTYIRDTYGRGTWGAKA